ncbi:MAG TPA: tRNA lysidine(34) synthetase TilS [Flavitalea sp.]|nr:tRNA lysidine(34) synthetase TilS [Flavitalea sp.]
MDSSSDMITSFKEFVVSKKLFSTTDHLVLAVSGGVDSIVLCELIHQTGYTFSIAHMNFSLRGEESGRDEKFVEAIARTYRVDFFVKQIDTKKLAEASGCSIQEYARNARYEWFEELLSTRINNLTGAKYIVTAHHADDNIETVMMNFFRGTGIKGLRGMLPKQGMVVRPLLWCRKKTLLEFAVAHSLEWVEDSSNAESKYTRNFFRNKLIPLIREFYPATEESICANIEKLVDTEALYNQAIEFHRKKLLEKRGSEYYIPILKLLKSLPAKTILYELIAPFGFTSAQSEAVLRLTGSETGKFLESQEYMVFRNRKWLVISPRLKKEATAILISEDDTKIEFRNGLLILKTKPVSTPSANPWHAMMDADKIRYPLLLRRWKEGDYFYPFGMKKKKKLSRFFIDQKLSKSEKENVWVVEMNRKIIWVVGHRSDNRFRVTPSTRQVITLEYISVN